MPATSLSIAYEKHRASPPSANVSILARSDRESDEGQPRVPLGFLLALASLALDHLFDGFIEAWSFVILELQLGEPAFVVDGRRRAVVDSAVNVLDTDIVANDRRSTAIACLTGGIAPQLARVGRRRYA